ncbi:MAG: Gfo/Idh/MocA family oxidoreductase [Clostridiales bacterium]|nr:Gfo/Idh/MocA family oxidoreductase [Clostridiales bacterium]
MKRLKAALIGYGRSGRDIHKHLFDLLPDLYEVVAVVDRDPQRRDMARRELGCPVYERYQEMFGQVEADFAVNASFSHEHHPISMHLLQQGWNVLSEKPAATNRKDFDEMVAQARKSGKLYLVFQQYRFSPAFIKIQEMIASGKVGRLVQVSARFKGFNRRWDWQTVHAFGAGSLLNTGAHPVDLMLALMGFPEDVEVFAAMDRAMTYGDAEDYVKVMLRAKGVPVADIEITASDAFGDDIFLVQGTRGTIKGNDSRLELRYYIPENEPVQKLTMEPLRDAEGAPIYCHEKLTIHHETWEADPHGTGSFDTRGVDFYSLYYDVLVHGAEPVVKNEHVALQMSVMEEAHRQNRELFIK